MSLWFRTRDEDGTVHYILVPFEPLAAISLVGACLALLLPLLQTFRVAVVASPVVSAGIITSILLVGAALFVLAKMSVIRAGARAALQNRHVRSASKPTVNRCRVSVSHDYTNDANLSRAHLTCGVASTR